MGGAVHISLRRDDGDFEVLCFAKPEEIAGGPSGNQIRCGI
jgi:hypothetical protein